MEKLKFTIRFIILLAAFPVIMFTELTRDEKSATGQKQITNEKVSEKTNDFTILSYTSFFMQAVLI